MIFNQMGLEAALNFIGARTRGGWQMWTERWDDGVSVIFTKAGHQVCGRGPATYEAVCDAAWWWSDRCPADLRLAEDE